MKFILEIKCDNAAFGDGMAHIEVAQILRELADNLENENPVHGLRDSNGNRVGGCEFSDEPLTCGF